MSTYKKPIPPTICEKCHRRFGSPRDLSIHHSQPCEMVVPLPKEKAPKKTPITDKICKVCGRRLKIGKFDHYENNPDGFSNWCKECDEKRKKLRNRKAVI